MLSDIKKPFPSVLVVGLVLLQFIAYPMRVSAGEVIKIGGVGSALGTMKLLASAFEKKHPGIRVEVLSSIGSSGALKAVPAGGVDIGLVTKIYKDEELSQGLSVLAYARTPFIFVTRKEIEQNSLTTEEIIKIYREEKETWPNGERIRWILRPARESGTMIVRSMSAEVAKALDNALSKRGRMSALTDQENLDLIEKTPGAFGYTAMTQVISEKRQVKVLSLNGVLPSVKTLDSGSYPLYKTYFLLTKKVRSDKVRKFIDFVRSEEGGRILRNTGNLVIRVR